MAKRVDITGQRFGHLTVIRYVRPDIHRNSIYECRCDCGRTCYRTVRLLRSGVVSSCGCRIKGRVENPMGERVIRRVFDTPPTPITPERKARFNDDWMFGSDVALRRLRTMFR